MYTFFWTKATYFVTVVFSDQLVFDLDLTTPVLRVAYMISIYDLCLCSTDEDEQQELLGKLREDAEAGSIPAQVFLGKYFLKCSELSNGSGDADSTEKEMMAVNWLIKASKQGSEEATDLLIICVKRSIGNSTNICI